MPYERAAARSSIRGSTVPRLYTPPLVEGPPGPCGCGCALTPATSLGFECVEFAEAVLAVRLIPWQRWLLIHMLELDAWGLYRFRTVLVLVARQNGKTTLMAVLALWRMLMDGAEVILGTSTNLDYAKMAWLKSVEHAESCQWLNDPAHPELRFRRGRDGRVGRRTNGEVNLETSSGACYKIATATRTGGRSLSVDLLLLDELREHKTWDAWSASSKTTNARPKGQKVAITNQGDRTGVVLNHLRAIGLVGIGVEVQLEPDEDGELADVVADDTMMIAEWSAPPHSELTDRTAWAWANPSLGYTIEEATILSDSRNDPADVFRVEVLCERVDQLDAVIDPEALRDCLDESGTMDGLRTRLAACVDISLDGTHATLVAAGQLDDGRVRVEVIDAWRGANAAEDARVALAAWRKLAKPKIVGWYPAGPGAALADNLKEDKKARALTGSDVAAACALLKQQITARRILYNGDALLTTQLTAAGQVAVVDGWRFVRRGAPSVDAAYAVAGAVFLARTLPKSLGKPRVIVGSA